MNIHEYLKHQVPFPTHCNPCFIIFSIIFHRFQSVFSESMACHFMPHRGRSVTTTSSDGTLKIWNARMPWCGWDAVEVLPWSIRLQWIMWIQMKWPPVNSHSFLGRWCHLGTTGLGQDRSLRLGTLTTGAVEIVFAGKSLRPTVTEDRTLLGQKPVYLASFATDGSTFVTASVLLSRWAGGVCHEFSLPQAMVSVKIRWLRCGPLKVAMTLLRSVT